MSRLSLCIVLISVMTFTAASPQPHHGGPDPYSPVIDFLKQLRKARKHSGSVIGNREGEEGTAAQSPSFTISQQSPNSQSPNSQYQPQQSQTSTPILFPSGGGGGGNSPSFGSSGSGSSPNDQKINIQFPANFPNFPSATSSPADITRVNNGVTTILQGVRSFDLGQILRGAFIFPRNENVKNVANNVLDNIFGGIKPPSK